MTQTITTSVITPKQTEEPIVLQPMKFYRSKFGLLPFFDDITDQEVSIFARKHWRAYFQDSKEDFEMEIYIICLEEADALEKMAIKSCTGIPDKIQPQEYDNIEYRKFVAKSYRTMLKTFLKFRVSRWNEEAMSQKFTELKNKNGAFTNEAFLMMVEKALKWDYDIPQELLDLYNLRHLKDSQAVPKVLEKHNLPNRRVLTWRKKTWMNRALNYFEKPITNYTHQD